jgi:chemotaxis protein CheY-P-specific phosphatase CheC
LRLFRSQKELQDRPSSPSEMKLVQELSNQMLLTLAKAMGSLVSINTEAGTESLHSVINDLMIEAQKVSSRLENKKKVFEHEPEIDSVSRSIRIYS